MFLDIGTLLRPTRVSPIDVDCLSIGAVAPHWIPSSSFALFFRSYPAVVATSGVEEYAVGAHHVVTKNCKQSSNSVPIVASRALTSMIVEGP